MNARDDEWHEERDCKMVGGPCDGDVRAMKRGWSDYVLMNQHLEMGANLGRSLHELRRKAAAGEILSEEDVNEHFDDQRKKDEEDGTKLPLGGHLYRRGEDRTTFHYVGPISPKEARNWSGRNVIPPPCIYEDRAMWERQFGDIIDKDQSANE